MRAKKKQLINSFLWNKINVCVRNSLVWGLFAVSGLFFVQIKSNCADNIDSNEKMLQQYVRSKGAGTIIFDASNIKQYWIDNSVVAQDDSFTILLNPVEPHFFESVPLKIQLANVNETQDCKIEVIADTDNFSFSILGKQAPHFPSSFGSEIVTPSFQENNCLHYKVASAVISPV